MLQNKQPTNLVKELPPDPSGPGHWWDEPGHWRNDPWALVKDLMSRVRGEMREISGTWNEVQEPFPNLTSNPEVFQSQYCHSTAEAKSMTPWSGTGPHSQSAFAGKGKPASGGKGKGKGEGKGKGKPAPGGEGNEEPSDNTMVMRDPNDENRHWRRDARVCGLPDLFHQFGGQWTAKEIFEYYESLGIRLPGQ